MTHREFLKCLQRRTSAAGLDVSDGLSEQLATYFEALSLWNRTINLSGFSLDNPSDAAIDRLIIEPLAAAQAIRPRVKLMVDIGSGGGSPGIPMSLALSPELTILVESRTRKGTFLREVARRLELPERVQVLTQRFEGLALDSKLLGAADLVTVRAVKLGSAEITALSGLLSPNGQMVHFGSADSIELPEGFRLFGIFKVPTDRPASFSVIERG